MSLLPNADRAIIAAEKLQYLLNPSHRDNRGKARVFARLGYSGNNWQVLEHDIRAQHLSCDTRPGKVTPYGLKFEIEAPLQGPIASATIVTVWMFDEGSEVPRFITAHPA